MEFEFLKHILVQDNPSELIKENENRIFNMIPELSICKGFKQNNEWHIYDVYEHILHVVDNVPNNIELRLAALFHDIGKPFVYHEDEHGIGHFFGHWNKSNEIFESFASKYNISDESKKLISNLIFYHDVNVEKMSEKEINDMINNIGISNIKLLFSLKRADLLAQSPEYHYLLENINLQEEKIIELSKKIKD